MVSMFEIVQHMRGDINQLTELMSEYSAKQLTGFGRIKWAAERERVNHVKDSLRERRNQFNTLVAMNTLSISSQTQVSLSKLLIDREEADRRATQRYESLNEQLERIMTSLSDKSVPKDPSGMSGRTENGASTKSHKILAVELTETPLNCTISCQCSCHRRIKFSILSSLFVGYTGSIMRMSDCHKYNCLRGPTAFKGYFTYFFPWWFVRRSFTIGMKISRLGDPSVSIVTHYVLSRHSEPFRAVERGDTKTLLEMLSNRTLHPNSVESQFGDTLLQEAVSSAQPDVCDILIRAGADPTFENNLGLSAIDTAWYMMLSAPGALITKSLSNLFSRFDDLDSWQLTVLHRIALGLVSVDTKVPLALAPSEIDILDACGRTPLWWACDRGNIVTIMALLRSGADPNIADIEGFSPFLNVISSHCPFEDSNRLEIAQSMLQYGARVTDCTKYGCNSISLASRLTKTGILELLLSSKPDLDINWRDYQGRTPLIVACGERNLAVMSFLLDQGADPSIADNSGRNCFHFSSTFEDPTFMNALLTSQSRFGVLALDDRGDTALHIAVSQGNIGALSALLNTGINPDSFNGNGYTVLDIAARNDRSTSAAELISYGADIHGCNPQGETPLFTAIINAAFSTVKLLLSRGATRSDLYNRMSDSDALSHACLHVELFDIVVLLLTHFPEISTCNMNQNTVLHFATIRKGPELLEKLATVDHSLLDLSAVNRFGKTAVDYLEEGNMVQERKLAFCKLLHSFNFTTRILCPQCGEPSGLLMVTGDDSDDEMVFVDCEG